MMTIEEIRKAAQLYVKGWTPREIGKRLGFRATDVREALRCFGFAVR